MAAIVYILAAQMCRQRKTTFDSYCMTFGTPFFGDEEAQSIAKKWNLDLKMFHFINDGDFVPLALSYAQIMDVIMKQHGHLLSGIVDTYSDTLAKSILLLRPCLEAMSPLVSTSFNPMITGSLGIIKGLIGSINKLENDIVKPYVGIGNFVYFEGTKAIQVKSQDTYHINGCFSNSLKTLRNDADQSIQNLITSHMITKYNSSLDLMWSDVRSRMPLRDKSLDVVPNTRFDPKISHCSLVKRDENMLEIQMFGENLVGLVISKMTRLSNRKFDQKLIWIEKESFESGQEKMHLKVSTSLDMTNKEHGVKMEIFNLFSKVEYLIPIGSIILGSDVKPVQTFRNDGVVVLVQRAIARYNLSPHLASSMTNILKEIAQMSKSSLVLYISDQCERNIFEYIKKVLEPKKNQGQWQQKQLEREIENYSFLGYWFRSLYNSYLAFRNYEKIISYGEHLNEMLLLSSSLLASFIIDDKLDLKVQMRLLEVSEKLKNSISLALVSDNDLWMKETTIVYVLNFLRKHQGRSPVTEAERLVELIHSVRNNVINHWYIGVAGKQKSGKKASQQDTRDFSNVIRN